MFRAVSIEGVVPDAGECVVPNAGFLPFLTQSFLPRCAGTGLHKEDRCMNKSELIESIAEHADVSKANAAKMVDAFVASVQGALRRGEQVSLVGFGTFLVREREARTGRNPRTGEAIQIAASKTPSFKAGKALKDALN